MEEFESMNDDRMTVGLIAPAFSLSLIDKPLQKNGYETLCRLGYEVKSGAHILNQRDYSSGTIEERLSDFNGFLSDPSVDIIMSVIGGYSSNHLLPYLDYDQIKESGKKIVGYSDVTALLNGIYAKTGMITYLGPAFVTFCNPSLYRETVRYFNYALQGKCNYEYEAPEYYACDDWFLKENYGPREEKKLGGWKFVREGCADGIFVGGNLGTLTALIGTEYFPDMNGKILLLEGNYTDNPAVTDQNITHLKQMGVFEQINGLIIGKYGTPFYETETFKEIILKNTEDKTIPVVMDVTCSHVDPIYTFPIGGKIVLDADKQKIKRVE